MNLKESSVYFRRTARDIVTRPSLYSQLLNNTNLPEADTNRNILIFPSHKQILPISSHPKNSKSSTKTTDPLAPYSLSEKIISEYIRNHGLDKKTYLLHLGYINDGGILVIDPVNMKAVNETYEPYLNYSGLDVKKYGKVMEKRKFRKEWYLKHGFKEEEIEKINIVEDMEPEKKAATKNRKIIRENLLNFLKPFYETHGEKLKVFVFAPRNSFEYKAVASSLKKLNAQNCLIHKNLKEGKDYSSLQGLKIEIENLLYQFGIQENIRLEKYFSNVDFDFNWPPEFDPNSNSYTIFPTEFLEKERNNVFGKIITDRQRYENFLEEYKNFLQAHSFNEDEIEKKIENLPSYEPIENLILKQWEKIGELKPFTQQIKSQMKSLNEKERLLKSFSPSQFSAPCTLTRIYQALNIEIMEKEEEEKVFLGKKYHELILNDPQENAYINHEIWKLVGLQSLQRSFYTERQLSGEIKIGNKDVYLSGITDAISICGDEIVLFEYKLSQVLPEIYKKSHAKQLLAYKKILESLGYKVADIGILLYGIAPPPKPELKSSVTNRYAIFSSNLREEFEDDLKDYFDWIEKLYEEPEKIKELRENEIERGCKICSQDSLAEKKDKLAIEKIKKIKQSA